MQFLEMKDENARLAEEIFCLHRQIFWVEKVQAENTDLKRQQIQVADEQKSTI